MKGISVEERTNGDCEKKTIEDLCSYSYDFENVTFFERIKNSLKYNFYIQFWFIMNRSYRSLYHRIQENELVTLRRAKCIPKTFEL